MIRCRKRGCPVTDDSQLELHHIVPRFMGGTDKDGRVRLCKKHHDIITRITPAIIWKKIKEEDKQEIRKAVESFTKHRLQTEK